MRPPSPCGSSQDADYCAEEEGGDQAVLLMPVPQAHDAGLPRHTTHSSARHRSQAEPPKLWVPKLTRKLNLQNVESRS